MFDRWIWEDGDTKNYIVRSGYKTFKEFDQSLGAPWFKQI